MTNPSSRPTSDRPTSDQGISRRDLLRGASVGIAASVGASLLPTFGYSQQPGQSTPASASLPEEFSRNEFLRRWQRVRNLMKEAQLDCLIVPAGHEAQPDEPHDVTYLTGTGAGWVVFPYEGSPIAIGGRRRGGPSGLGIELRPDGRPPGSVSGNAVAGHWSPAVIDALRDRGMSRARIGIGNLVGVYRDEEGGVSYTTLDRITKAFPHAQFESGVDVLMKAHLVRGPEEIAVMEKANEVAWKGVATLLDTVRPGVSFTEVWLKIFQTLAVASGELGAVALSVGDTRATGPNSEVLRAGTVMDQEITGRVRGYNMQVNFGAAIGTPVPPEWNSAAPYCIEVYDRLLDFMAPGKSLRELNNFYVNLLAKKGLTEPGTTVIYHLGAGARSGPNRREGMELVLEPGWVFHTVKPTIPMPNANAVARFGDGVVITDTGARRIGNHKFEVLTLGA